MSDIFTNDKRSAIMSKIRSKNTKLEILVRKYLFAEGFRYRLNVKKLPGNPDIVLTKYNTVIFINGCFWHGHSCKAGKLPQTNLEFWKDKINSNIERDNKNIILLKEQGWNVLVIWQCDIKNLKLLEERFKKLKLEIINKL